MGAPDSEEPPCQRLWSYVDAEPGAELPESCAPSSPSHEVVGQQAICRNNPTQAGGPHRSSTWVALAIGGDFVGQHLESGQLARTKRGGYSDIRGIPSACHQNATNAGHIVSGIKCVPALSEEYLKQALKSIGSRAGGTPISPK